MRTILRTTLLGLALILPAAAHAVDFVSVEGVADCNGWQSDVQVWFRDGANDVTLSYVVVLTDAQGAEVERFEHSEALTPAPGEIVAYSFDGVFGAAPGDGSQVRGDFTLLDNFVDGFNEMPGSFAAAVACTAGGDDGGGGSDDAPFCAHTARWWRRHPDAWPVRELEVGGVLMDERMLRLVLQRPAWGNPLMLLTQVVVASKFNALANPGSGMEDAIATADAYLADHPSMPSRRFGRFHHRGERVRPRDIRAVAMPLIIFNWGGCEDAAGNSTGEAGAVATGTDLLEKALTGEAAPVQDVSFGTLKSLYR